MAIVEIVLDGARYGIPLARVHEVAPRVAVRHLPGAPESVAGLVRYRGTVVVAIDLRARLGHPVRAPLLDDQLVIASTARRTVALLVDRIAGVREVPLSRVIPPPVGSRHIRGLVEIDDGLLLLQELDAVLSLDEERQLEQAAAEP